MIDALLAIAPAGSAGPMARRGELARLAGDHGATFAMDSGASRLDGRIQSEQVGLIGDVVHDLDFLSDLAHGPDRLADRLAALLGLAAGLVGHAGGLAGVL